ncbi:hypothetical protein [Rhodococcoides fascians]|uniref:hypothetical protein n=1 Tax=Rhodococcoides fascians TaxID=1828 RepID=UPI00056997B9|nr:hypothetical protein [Rhodococcus fascians]
MPLQIDGASIGEVYVGADPIGEGWVWDGAGWLQVFSAVSLPTAAGLVTTSSVTYPLDRDNVMTGWTVDPMRPETGLFDNGIRSDGDGFVHLVLTGSVGRTNGTQRASLTVNGATVATVTLSSGSFRVSVDVELSAGDVVRAVFRPSSSYFGSDRVESGATLALLPYFEDPAIAVGRGPMSAGDSFAGASGNITSRGWLDRAYGSTTFDASNGAVSPGTTSVREMNCYVLDAPLPSADHWVRARVASLPSSSTKLGVAARFDMATDNAILGKFGPTTWEVRYGVTDTTSSGTVLASGDLPAALAVGDFVEVRTEAGVLWLLVNGAVVEYVRVDGVGIAGDRAGVSIDNRSAGSLTQYESGPVSAR